MRNWINILNENTLSDEAKEFFDKAKIKKSNIIVNDDGSFDLKCSIDITRNIRKLDRLPVKFNIVDGSFKCIEVGLTSLEGMPRHVYGDYDIGYNNLTSLEGGPEFVSKTCSVIGNKIVDLKGAPKMAGHFYVTETKTLTSLKGVPEKFIHLSADRNPMLTPWEMRYILFSTLCQNHPAPIMLSKDYEFNKKIEKFLHLTENEKKDEIPSMFEFLKKRRYA